MYNLSRTPLLRHSEWFRERLQQPATGLQLEKPGVALDHAEEFRDAVRLHGVRKEEFDALLKILYPEYVHVLLTRGLNASSPEAAITTNTILR